MHQAFRTLVFNGRGPADEHLVAATSAYMDLGDYYWKRAIWLDPATCESINELMGKFHDLHVDLAVGVDENGRPRDVETGKSVAQAVLDEIPAARAVLQDRFRKLLGIPER